MLNFQQRVYSIHRIAAVVDELREHGLDSAQVLQGTGLTHADLASHDTRVSYAQVAMACRNALRLSSDPVLGLHAGQRMHITSYGLYGYAILSSRSTRESSDFSVKYHNIIGSIIGFDYDWTDDRVTWTYAVKLVSDPMDPLYRFSVEFGMASHLTVMRDLRGSAFKPLQASLVYTGQRHADLYEAVLGCKPRFKAPKNQLVFDAREMDKPKALGNPVTHAAMRALCEKLLLRLGDDEGAVVARVRRTLLNQPGLFPSASDMAGQLGMRVWTLRRRLAKEGTSYRRLLAEVREQLALEYLRRTRLTHEEIAARLGYSDAANFRQAFVRWTGRNPSEFRGRS